MINTILAMFASTVVTLAAPDGVNTITQSVDDNGIVTESSTLVNTYPIQVYRLLRDPNTERLWLVGQDYEKRECVILGVDEYAMLTGRLDQVWQSFNKTEDGRMKLHGKRDKTYLSDDMKEKVVVYSDGFVHREKAVVKSTNTVNRVRMQGVREQPKRPSFDHRRFSERHAKMKEEIERRKSGAIKTITVEHDAATGKDTVK